MFPIRQHSITLNLSPWCRSAKAHIVTVLGVISDTTSYQPSPLSCTVGNMLHSLSGRFKVCLGWLVSAYFSHSIHKAKGRVGPQSTKGIGYGHKGGHFPGCKVMILQLHQVGVWRCHVALI